MNGETSVISIDSNGSCPKEDYSPVTSSSSKDAMDTLVVADICPSAKFKTVETQTYGVSFLTIQHKFFYKTFYLLIRKINKS